MTYSSGGLIQAADYNGFAGGNVGANVSGQLNTVLGTGYGNAGYGQVGVSNVTAVSDTVTATQWTTLINNINKVRKHQSGAGYSNIGTVVTGDTISAVAAVSANLTTAYSNRLLYAASGSTTTGSNFNTAFTLTNGTAGAQGFTRTVTFASADQARYFFNAGGYLTLVMTAVNNDGTSRSGDIVTLLQTNFASKSIKAKDLGARSGTGGTATDLTTGAGFYSLTTTAVQKTIIYSATAPYTADYFQVQMYTSGATGSYGAPGLTVIFYGEAYAGAQSPAFNDTVNVTMTSRVDITYPETTYLTNTWGTPTVS